MPKQKDLKRLVRARMKKTGESYTAARGRLLEKEPARRPRAKPATSPAVDLAALAGYSDAVLVTRTGRAWKEWVTLLDRAGARELAHGAIARIVHEEHGVPGWWSQAVTVGYERIRGLRERGQRRDGTYDVNKSKVVPVPLATLWDAFARFDWLDAPAPRTSKATRHKTMRLRWTDGTPVEAHFVAKGPAKAQVFVAHRKLASRAEAERLRAAWTAGLARLAEALAGRKR